MISIASYSQYKLYAIRISNTGARDSFLLKIGTDSLFTTSFVFQQFSKEHFQGQFSPSYPNSFELFSQRGDDIWTNTSQQFESGEYTPTLTNTTNVTASSAFLCNYLRIGNKVVVYGAVSIDANLAASTELQMTLPISSNMTGVTDLGGTGAILSSSISNISIAVRADASTDRAAFVFLASSTTNNTYTFSFSYTIK